MQLTVTWRSNFALQDSEVLARPFCDVRRDERLLPQRLGCSSPLLWLSQRLCTPMIA
jgi:hypothetical protein